MAAGEFETAVASFDEGDEQTIIFVTTVSERGKLDAKVVLALKTGSPSCTAAVRHSVAPQGRRPLRCGRHGPDQAPVSADSSKRREQAQNSGVATSRILAATPLAGIARLSLVHTFISWLRNWLPAQCRSPCRLLCWRCISPSGQPSGQ